MITGNKGEWSEIYALLKLLGDKKLYAGDAALNKIERTTMKMLMKIIIVVIVVVPAIAANISTYAIGVLRIEIEPKSS